MLDRRSTYGTFWFPEPLRSDEMDVDREIRVDYFHGEKSGQQTSQVKAELEWNFDLVTVEVAGQYENSTTSIFDPVQHQRARERSEGLGNVNVAVRGPLWEWVVPAQNFDYTLAGGFEAGMPSGSDVSKDAEFVPALFQLMRIGDHFSVQIATGVSFLVGPGDGGTNTLETNAILGYHIEHDELPLPGVLSTVPMFELNDETVLSGPDRGTNRLSGTLGARVNFNSIGAAQPRLGLGYVFPIDAGAHDKLRWGVVVSVVFEL